MKAIGINISDSSVEAVVLTKSLFGGIKCSTVSRRVLPDGTVHNGKIADAVAMASELKQLFASAQPKPIQSGKIALSIPEAQTFTRILRFPIQTTDKEMEASVLTQISQYLPFEPSELVYDYIDLGSQAESKDVLVVAANKQVVAEYVTAVTAIGHHVHAIELESLSAARAVLDIPTDSTIVMLLDIGARTTNISFFGKQGLLFTYSVPIAGNEFTQTIASALRISENQAEKLKCERGFSESGRSKYDVKEVLTKAFTVLVQKINEGIDYVEDTHNTKVHHAVIIGGSAQLPQLGDFLQDELHMPMMQATILPAIAKHSIFKPFNVDEVLYYNAVGLALGQLNPPPHNRYINFNRS